MTFLRKITRPATAIALGLSVALSPLATTPAKAGNEDAFIAGAIGTLILGAIAAEALNGNGTGRITVHAGNGTGTQHQPHRPGTHHQPHRPGTSRPNHHDPHRPGHPPHQPRHQGGDHTPNFVHARSLPQQCAVDMRKFGERGTVYGKRCMNNRYPLAYSLPQQCLTHRLSNATGRHRPAYGARCLEQHGYDVARYGRRH